MDLQIPDENTAELVPYRPGISLREVAKGTVARFLPGSVIGMGVLSAIIPPAGFDGLRLLELLLLHQVGPLAIGFGLGLVALHRWLYPDSEVAGRTPGPARARVVSRGHRNGSGHVLPLAEPHTRGETVPSLRTGSAGPTARGLRARHVEEIENGGAYGRRMGAIHVPESKILEGLPVHEGMIEGRRTVICPGQQPSAPTAVRTDLTPNSALSAPWTSAFEFGIRADKLCHTEPSRPRTQSPWLLSTARTCSWHVFLDPALRSNTRSA